MSTQKKSSEITSRKLDVGCCFRKPKGYWGIDRVDVDGVDQVHDLTQFPWPLPDNYFEEVRVWHILQFLPDTVKTMEEIWRVAKPGAKVLIGVPYYKSGLAFGDPSHIRYFTEATFKFFTDESWYISHQDAFTQAKFNMVKQELRTSGRMRKLIPFKNFLKYFLWDIRDEIVVEFEVLKSHQS